MAIFMHIFDMLQINEIENKYIKKIDTANGLPAVSVLTSYVST